MARTPRTRTAGGGDPAAEIVDAALALAEERGWRGVRLVDVAERLGLAPQDILAHYRDLDGVTDAWLRRGLAAMIAPKDAGFEEKPAKERVEICMLAFLDALAPHRRVTAEMVRGKMHLPHPHHWAPMIFNLSRTIHWLREAARLPATYGTRRAEIEEMGLTALFVATFAVWTRDATEGQARTRRYLSRRLAHADRLLAGLCRPAAGRRPARRA